MPDRSMLVLYPASAAVSSVVSSCFIYEPVKSTKLAFSRNALLSVPSGNPRSETPHSLRIPVQRTPPCLRNSSSKNPSMPLEFQKAIRRWVRIFSGIAQSMPTTLNGSDPCTRSTGGELATITSWNLLQP